MKHGTQQGTSSHTPGKVRRPDSRQLPGTPMQGTNVEQAI